MPRQVLFIQGAGEGVHDGWDDKLVHSLQAELGQGYAVRYPRMPDEANPTYETWKSAMLKEFDALEDDAILVGHSIGGTILLQVLVECRPQRRWGAVVLIAPPFFGEGGWQDDEAAEATELAQPLAADVPVFLYHGSADDEVPLEHMHLYAGAIPHARTRVLADRDHQLNNDLGEIARNIRDALQPR